MEARSLTSLNFLAANPPQYPVRPNEEKLEPLTLYILRVPGTRDVFLSPFKPQVKSVTAEDIASSLYYVHLRDLVDENSSLPTEERLREHSPSQANIARKPLPSTARLTTPDGSAKNYVATSTQRAGLAPTHASESSYQQKISPLAQTVTSAESPSTNNLARVPARKPVGPRPMGVNPQAFPEMLPSMAPSNQVQDVAMTLPPPGSFEADNRGRVSADLPSSHTSTWGSPATPSSFSLDIIRRDRSSGGQWNVARVSCLADQGKVETSHGRRPSSPSKAGPLPAIDVSIENSGYAKFRNIPSQSMVEAGPAAIMEALAGRASGRSSDHSSSISLPLVGDAAAGEMSTTSGFHRQVTMDYAKSWTANVKDKLQKLESEARARTGHIRGDSAASRVSVDQGTVPTEQGAQGTKPIGYAFNSPWNSRCEFRTGNGGRTLRCVHTLESGAANGSASTESVVVSELRFNLPNSEVIPGAAHPKDSQLLGHFGRALRSRARSDPYSYEAGRDEDETHEPHFDLSLGKERAGGGRRGNRAKMGKLIITGEGLKMLDLVVSANMGVWWKTWERSF